MFSCHFLYQNVSGIKKNNVDCPDSTGRESMKSLILSVAAYVLILC